MLRTSVTNVPHFFTLCFYFFLLLEESWLIIKIFEKHKLHRKLITNPNLITQRGSCNNILMYFLSDLKNLGYFVILHGFVTCF